MGTSATSSPTTSIVSRQKSVRYPFMSLLSPNALGGERAEAALFAVSVRSTAGVSPTYHKLPSLHLPKYLPLLVGLQDLSRWHCLRRWGPIWRKALAD